MAVRKNETRRRLGEFVGLQIDQATEARANLVVGRAEGERFVEAIEELLGGNCVCRAQTNKYSCAAHQIPTRVCASRNRTTNSVPFASERASHRSPPCRRASSRARFNPNPCPGTFSPTAPR